ncbi:MAG: sarcosine oxidase subunit gamma [Mesorhizobium amorphae]|nr:MAG: sarcosine oxidase subunit gamma [Mesorhizobium amorphae]
MAEQLVAERRSILQTRGFDAPGVSITLAEPANRVSLRARAGDVDALNRALSIGLPAKPKTSARENGLAALWLGPDEWLLIGEGRDPLSELRGTDALHSAVDVSHRNLGIVVSGPHAASAISGGCPQDLSPEVFGVGACSRTLLGKVEMVLWKTGEDAFRVECWRSFAPYVFSYLSMAARDAA